MKNEKNNIDYQRLDRPLGFRVPLEIHSWYKSLSGFGRKEIQYKFNLWIRKQLMKKGAK